MTAQPSELLADPLRGASPKGRIKVLAGAAVERCARETLLSVEDAQTSMMLLRLVYRETDTRRAVRLWARGCIWT